MEATDSQTSVVAYGDMYQRLKKAIQSARLNINLYNALFIKPLPEPMVKAMLQTQKRIFVVEEVTRISGLGSAILEFAAKEGIDASHLQIMALPDQFIEHGSVDELLKKYQLDTETIIKEIKTSMEW